MTLTKNQIIDRVFKRFIHKWSKVKASKSIDTLLEIIKKTLENGSEVMVSNFGKFTVSERAAKKGHNPATGDSLMIRPRKVVRFKPSAALKDKINVMDCIVYPKKTLSQSESRHSYRHNHLRSLF